MKTRTNVVRVFSFYICIFAVRRARTAGLVMLAGRIVLRQPTVSFHYELVVPEFWGSYILQIGPHFRN